MYTKFTIYATFVLKRIDKAIQMCYNTDIEKELSDFRQLP